MHLVPKFLAIFENYGHKARAGKSNHKCTKNIPRILPGSEIVLDVFAFIQTTTGLSHNFDLFVEILFTVFVAPPFLERAHLRLLTSFEVVKEFY